MLSNVIAQRLTPSISSVSSVSSTSLQIVKATQANLLCKVDPEVLLNFLLGLGVCRHPAPFQSQLQTHKLFSWKDDQKLDAISVAVSKFAATHADNISKQLQRINGAACTTTT